MSNPYREFFKDSDAGKTFMIGLDAMIQAQYRLAEDEPEMTIEHMQRAKGIRMVVSKINSLSAAEKKTKRSLVSQTGQSLPRL